MGIYREIYNITILHTRKLGQRLITWNAYDRCLEIAAGLPADEYRATSNGADSRRLKWFIRSSASKPAPLPVHPV